MGITLKDHTELNDIQVSLLRLFSRPMSKEETLEIRNLLVNHYSEMLNKEVTRVIKEKGYTAKDLENILNAES
ncbi:MAG TPA: hypothetical protein PKA53_05205 [Sphingobacterium sp.]|nr:hypothetical protein [Sphingobacterium sp.]